MQVGHVLSDICGISKEEIASRLILLFKANDPDTQVIKFLFNELLEKADLEKDDIDLFIFHQASAVILRQLKLKLNIPDEKWFQNIKNMGNTVSATIPIAIKQSIDSGLYKPNMKIMLMGFGVGLSIAGCIIRS